MNIIYQLPKFVSNQIAAGEVVQRPSSMVKELLENSIDAKAKNIKIIIKDAGKQSITIIDDGIGMSKEDAQSFRVVVREEENRRFIAVQDEVLSGGQ
jgi:DNA mismatch repair protein MutL